MKIRGAVLRAAGSPGPYADSAPLVIEELELAPPGPTELLVRIEAAGICHSDLSVVDGNRPRPLPMLLGHEAAGRVIASGRGEADDLLGRRVVMAFLPRCGECRACKSEGRLPCERGSASNTAGTLLSGESRLSNADGAIAHHLGVSAFATHAVVDRRSVVPVGDDVPPDIAALLGCAVLTGGGAVLNVARPLPGQTIAVVGLGGVGMAALLVALSLEGLEVVGIDPVPEKRRKAAELGAHLVLAPAEAEDRGLRAHTVIEAAGSARAFETAVAITAPGGRTVTVGLPPSDARALVAPLGLVVEAREIVGSYLGSAVPERDIPRFEELWRSGRLPLPELISSRITLADINQGMDELASGRAIRQMIEIPSPALREISIPVEGNAVLHLEGPREGQPALLLHGLGYASWAAESLRAELGMDVALWSLDNRGAGRSTLGDKALSIELLAEDVAHAIDALGGPVTLVGYSMGGYIAQLLASRRPDLVSRLVLIGTSPGGVRAVPVPDDTRRTWLESAGAPPDEYARLTMPLSFREGWTVSHAPQYEAILAARLAFPTPTEAWNAQYLACEQFLHNGYDIARLDVPALVLHGTADQVVPVENGRALTELLPDSQYREVAGAGHLLHLEQPDLVAREITRFTTPNTQHPINKE